MDERVAKGREERGTPPSRNPGYAHEQLYKPQHGQSS